MKYLSMSEMHRLTAYVRKLNQMMQYARSSNCPTMFFDSDEANAQCMMGRMKIILSK